jgi:hypothetical protein
MQIDVLRRILDSATPFRAFRLASEGGEIGQLRAHAEACNEFVQSEEVRKITCPDPGLLRYLDLPALRTHDQLADTLQDLQAEILRHDIRQAHWHAALEELAGRDELSDGDLDAPLRAKLLHWQLHCEANINYYRTWRDAEIELTRSFLDVLQRRLDTLADESPTAGPEAAPEGSSGEEVRLPEWIGEHFRRSQYKLMRLLWGKGEVPKVEIHKAIYGPSTGSEEALDKVKDRTNRKLAEINQPFEIVTRRGEVYILQPIER